MDIEYARLARDLPLPKGIVAAPRANVIENAAPSYKSPNAVASEEVSISNRSRPFESNPSKIIIFWISFAIQVGADSTQQASDAAGASSTRPIVDEDDDDEGGLC